MMTPKAWMEAGYPGFAELCDGQRMKVVDEGRGPRGEWYVTMQSTRFSLSIGEELGVSSYYPTISIKASHGQKRWGYLDKVLRDLGLWEDKASRLNERELARVLEAHLDVVLEYLEEGPS
jgi:hypothetical protein